MTHHDLEGKTVTEEEVAADLGFSSVHELRRWDAEQGQRVAKLEEELREARNDRDQFLWAGRRMEAVLRRLKPSLSDPELLLAIGIVLGEAVDWDHDLDGWWEDKGTEATDVLL